MRQQGLATMVGSCNHGELWHFHSAIQGWNVHSYEGFPEQGWDNHFSHLDFKLVLIISFFVLTSARLAFFLIFHYQP